MTSIQRQELILKKMKERGIQVGSGIPNKKYNCKEVYELIHIANCFPETIFQHSLQQKIHSL